MKGLSNFIPVVLLICSASLVFAATPAEEEEKSGSDLGLRGQRRAFPGSDNFFRDWDPWLQMDRPQRGASFYPRADVTETEEAIIVRCDLPGMVKEKIDVTFKDGNLIVSGTREIIEEESKGTSWYSYERSFGNFERVIPVSSEIKEKGITATYEKGVLTITLPKVKEAVKPGRKIKII